MIYALGMFHQISHPKSFLEKPNRLIKDSGVIVIDGGHQPQKEAKEKTTNSGYWEKIDEKDNYMKCKPIKR